MNQRRREGTVQHAQRIKKRFCDALLELSETTPLEKITVSALVEQAGTARQTFYNHFYDINDLVSYLPINFLNDHDVEIHKAQSLEPAYSYAREHAAFFRQLPHHSGQNNFRDSFVQWFENAYKQHYITDDMPEEEREYRTISIGIYACGITGVFLEWCKADFSWSLETLLRAQADYVPPFVYEDPAFPVSDSPNARASR